MYRVLAALGLSLILVPRATAQRSSAVSRLPSFEPKQGLVPDSVTAIKISEAILTPLYGSDHIVAARPFHASLVKGVWHVVNARLTPPGTVSLRPYFIVDVAQKDGRILRAWIVK